MDKGIWFPFSVEERKMKSGSISAGNAFNLGELLKKKDSGKIEAYFIQLKNEAQKKNCQSILLSAESLVHYFAKSAELEFLSNTLNASGFSKIYALAYFRDLVEHCLSLYKHRSKSGNNPDLEHWIKEHYETPYVLNDFFLNYRKVDFNWTFNKFRKDSSYMLETFFHNWLNVRIPNIPDKPRVNESLTLSEVLVIQCFKKYAMNTADAMTARLLKIKTEDKSSEQLLESMYKNKIAEQLNSKYRLSVEMWNCHLRPEHKIEIEPSKHFVSQKVEISISHKQIEEILVSSRFVFGYRGLLFRIRRFLKKLIPNFLFNIFYRK